jgi:DNA replication and repair protein RecF
VWHAIVWIKQLLLSNFRNFEYFSAEFSPEATLICGENGSGKTSLMEAIALFGFGRSFRGTKIKGLTKIGEKQPFQSVLTVCERTSWRIPATPEEPDNTDSLAYFEQTEFRVADQGYPHRLRFETDDGVVCASSVVAKVPLQLLYASSFNILEAGSTYRRQLLDWGCFFIKQHFSGAWRHYAGILKQRNALLRTMGGNLGASTLWEAWDKAFLEAAEAVEAIRRVYWSLFEPIFMQTIIEFLPTFAWRITYFPGYSVDSGLAHALAERFKRDVLMGYTSVGPHRADIEIYVGDTPARHVLSRGQTKLLICALLVARARLLFKETGRSCVLLVDDVDAELDEGALNRLFEGFSGLAVQWIATTTQPEGPLAKKVSENRILLPRVVAGGEGCGMRLGAGLCYDSA